MASKVDQIWRDVEVSIHWLWPFALAPFFMPILAVAAFGIGIAIGIAIGGGSGGAAGSQGGGGGALIGLAIGGALGVSAAMAVYLFIPLVSYLCVVGIYLFINALQEFSGQRLHVVIGGTRVSLKLAVMASFMSVGVISILLYYLAWSILGMSAENYQTAMNGFDFAWTNYWSLYTQSSDQISTEVSLHGLLGFAAVFAAVAWALMIYGGLNYFLSRSLTYCMGVYVTAFFLDLSFTILCYMFGFDRNYQTNDFFIAVNNTDDWLRETAMSPVRLAFGFLADFENLFDSLALLFSAVSGFIYAMIEAGLGAVLLEDGALKRAVYQALNFARFIEVDFLFFAVSSGIWATRLRRVRPNQQ